MIVINRRIIENFKRTHARSRKPLKSWIKVTEEAHWGTLVDMRNTFNSADLLDGNTYCFNIGGNNFRMEAVVSFGAESVTVTRLETHAEYTQRMRRQ